MHMYYIGRILNRFSKDIGFMDDVLPYQFMELFTVSGICIANILVTSVPLVAVEILCHYDSSLCGKLLALHSCYYHSWSPAIFSLVLLAHIEAYQKTRSTW